MTKLFLTNSLTRKKEEFHPINRDHIKMYACGPTVYDRPHLGNARAAMVYDLLYRVLKENYPKVTYISNITDVDDKIIAAAHANKEKISHLTLRMEELYHQDMRALNCLPPDREPRATEHIEEMIAMISDLIAKGHAYEAQNHVLFSVSSFPDYGLLSRRSRDEMIAGARVEVAPYKKDPADFVLWKPAPQDELDSSFASPWGRGRPGWHIECSAMCKAHLGSDFDIHGGGADLMFPHHENEIAQSYCANGQGHFARYWVHNGFLTVNGEKMSKSLGNFKTINDVLQEGIAPEVIRYFYLTTHYRKPLDYNQKSLQDAKKSLEKFSALTLGCEMLKSDEIMQALNDDLNTPLALAKMHEYASQASKGDKDAARHLLWSCHFLGIKFSKKSIPQEVVRLAEERLQARAEKDWAKSDELRDKILALGYDIKDVKDGYEIN
jgi:cysteinyl-tRNA synthetase